MLLWGLGAEQRVVGKCVCSIRSPVANIISSSPERGRLVVCLVDTSGLAGMPDHPTGAENRAPPLSLIAIAWKEYHGGNVESGVNGGGF